MRERSLTLPDVPDRLLQEFGFSRGCMDRATYTYKEADAVLVPISRLIVPPQRMLNEDTLRELLDGIRTDSQIPAVKGIYEPKGVRLLDGMHRYRVSQALGFRQIPCDMLDRDTAEAAFRYEGSM